MICIRALKRARTRARVHAHPHPHQYYYYYITISFIYVLYHFSRLQAAESDVRHPSGSNYFCCKSNVGLASAKAAALLNLDSTSCSVVAPPIHAPSRTPLHLPLLLSHNLHPCPRPTSYNNILKGLTEGGPLCPLLWGLCMGNLVTTLQRSLPHIILSPPDLTCFIDILLFVDDFALIASKSSYHLL
jgi:hypothetical protein